jgi:hypothetical protein
VKLNPVGKSATSANPGEYLSAKYSMIENWQETEGVGQNLPQSNILQYESDIAWTGIKPGSQWLKPDY